jgi:hypothetical protein
MELAAGGLGCPSETQPSDTESSKQPSDTETSKQPSDTESSIQPSDKESPIQPSVLLSPMQSSDTESPTGKLLLEGAISSETSIADEELLVKSVIRGSNDSSETATSEILQWS